MALTNDKMQDYPLLQDMYEDSYFPPALVDKCKQILLDLCGEIEKTQPADNGDFLELTHAATERINELQDEFLENDSELETAAREILAADFDYITQAYGFDLDIEDVIAPREW